MRRHNAAIITTTTNDEYDYNYDDDIVERHITTNNVGEETTISILSPLTTTVMATTTPTSSPSRRRRLSSSNNDNDDDDDDEQDFDSRGGAPKKCRHRQQRRQQSETNNGCRKYFYFPPFRRMSLTKLTFLTVLCSIPCIIFVLAFSAMGSGRSNMLLSRDLISLTPPITQILALAILLLYLLDVSYWTSPLPLLIRHVLFILIIVAIVDLIILTQSVHPTGPLCLFIVGTSFWILCIKQIFFQGVTMRVYVSWMGLPLLLTSVAMLMLWLMWALMLWEEGEENHRWSDTTKVSYAIDMGCVPRFEMTTSVKNCRNETLWMLNGTEGVCFSLWDEVDDGRRSGSRREVIIFDEGCPEYCLAVYDKCVHAFLVWANPMLGSLGLLLLSFTCGFLNDDSSDNTNRVDNEKKKVKDNEDDEGGGGGGGGGGQGGDFDMNDDYEWNRGFLFFAKAYLLLLFALWCGFSLAGAGDGLTESFVAYTLASIVAVGILLFATSRRYRWASSSSSYYSSFQNNSNDWSRLMCQLFQKYDAYMDILRSLVVIACMPVILCYLCLSVANQMLRRWGWLPCSKRIVVIERRRDGGLIIEDEEEEEEEEMGRNGYCCGNWRLWLTDTTREQIRDFETWDHSKIFRYAIYWGIAFMTLQIFVQQFTVVFLSWLIQKTQSMNLSAVTIIIIIAGMFLFLTPPVPGGPIYIAMGIVIVSSGRDTLGIVGSVVYCFGLSLFIKLLACTVQQKFIGEYLSQYVEVRRLVNMNSRLIRAVRLVLSQKGLSLAKVAILVGGPDWPTSVLCGIMRLDLIPNLIGTLPIVIIIIPMVLTGTFTYMSSLPPQDGVMEYPWAGTVCAITVVITATVQFGSMAAAAHFIEKTLQNQSHDIDRIIPIDFEVEEAEKRSLVEKQIFEDISNWRSIPRHMKIVLMISLVCMITCCYVAQIFRGDCFVDYDFTSVGGVGGGGDDDDAMTIGGGEGGRSRNILKPLGWFVMMLFFVSCLCLAIFLTWAKKNTHDHFKEGTLYTHGYLIIGETVHPMRSMGLSFDDDRLNYLSSPRRYGSLESF